MSAYTIDRAKVLAQIRINAILDGSADRDRLRAWHEASQLAQDPNARLRAQRAAREQKKRDESFARLEQWAHQRRAAKRAKEGATSGPGWRIIDRPHEELEALAKRIFGEAFHHIPWIGWRVRWGRLSPPTPGIRVLGRAVQSARVIVIDAEAHRGRTGRDLIETVTHELIHVMHAPGGHHANFAQTLERVLAVVLPTDELEAAAQTATRPHPEPRRGVTPFGVIVRWPGAGELEFR